MSDNFFDVEKEQEQKQEELKSVQKKKRRDVSLFGFLPSSLPRPKVYPLSSRTIAVLAVEVFLIIYLVLGFLGRVPLF